MNMFRDLAMVALIAMGVTLFVSNPMDWSVMSHVPPEVGQGVNFLVITKPFSSVVCFALALALFMTRLKY